MDDDVLPVPGDRPGAQHRLTLGPRSQPLRQGRPRTGTAVGCHSGPAWRTPRIPPTAPCSEWQTPLREQARQDSNLQPPVLERGPSDAGVGAFVDFQGLRFEPPTPALLDNAGVGTTPGTEKAWAEAPNEIRETAETGISPSTARARLAQARASAAFFTVVERSTEGISLPSASSRRGSLRPRFMCGPLGSTSGEATSLSGTRLGGDRS